MTALKSFDQALTEMLRAYWSLTGQPPDLVEGSVLRSLFEPLAFQINDLSARFDTELEIQLPEAIFEAFGFARRLATSSRTVLRVEFPVELQAPFLIPAGTTWATTDGVEFVTVQDVTAPSGVLYQDAAALAVLPGAAGNVPSFSTGRLTSGLPGVAMVLNPVPGAGGSDAETLAAQSARFLLYLDALDRSSSTGLRSALLSVILDDGQALADCLIADGNDDPAILAGTFRVYLYAPGGVSALLQAACAQTVEAARAAGCLPTFVVVPGTPVDVTVNLYVTTAGTKVLTDAAVGAYFGSLSYGQYVSLSNLIAVLKSSSPNVLDIRVTTPAADAVPPGLYAHLQLGALVINEVVTTADDLKRGKFA
jgi:uncharacterized phage protein gp47/JayE